MINKARIFRDKINANLVATRKLIRVDELTEDELNDMIHIYEPYKPNYPYIKDDRFHYEGKLYEVIQAHTSLENWKPNELPALYKEVMPKQVIPNWVKPTGSHDAYKIGNKVIFEGHVWVSKIDNNTWSPTEYPTGWNKEFPYNE